MDTLNKTKGSIKVSSNNGCGSIYISGGFTFNLQLELRNAYEGLISKNKYIQIDFQKVDYMDSSGLGMLLVMKTFLDEKKISYELLKVNGQAYDLLSLTHFSKYFKINGNAVN